MYNIAVILAGGIGTRVGGSLPKQLLPLSDGKSVLEHTVDAFEKASCINEICIVMHPDYIAHAEQMLLANAWQKVHHIIPGGKERWESSVNAIRLYMNQPSVSSSLQGGEFSGGLKSSSSREDLGRTLLLHDAARPFVSQQIIAEVCQALETREAVVVAVPSTDTVYEMVDGKVARIPNRATIMRAQTPQAFRLPLIAEAYCLALGIEDKDYVSAFRQLTPERCAALHLPATDDCGVVFQHLPNTSIHIVQGEEQNRKITFKEDI